MSFDLHGTARTARNKTAAQRVKRAKAVGEEGMKYMADQDLVAIWLITPPETEKGASVRKMLSYTKMERYEPENEEHRRLRDRIDVRILDLWRLAVHVQVRTPTIAYYPCRTARFSYSQVRHIGLLSLGGFLGC